MLPPMAGWAKGDEVLLRVVAALASNFQVMNLKFTPPTAKLTFPAVALQHLPM